jgi:hypothetical protein
MLVLLEDDGLQGVIAQTHIGARLELCVGRRNDEMYLRTPGEDGGILGSLPSAQARFLSEDCRDFGCGLRFVVHDKWLHGGALEVQVAIFATDGKDLGEHFALKSQRERVRALAERRRVLEGRLF